MTTRAAGSGGPRVPAHQVTTRNLGAAYPFVAETGLGHRGVVVGNDLLGGSFVFDPFELYEQGILSNPNLIVFGQIGRGKSAFVKTFLWRQAVFGRRAWVVDPKGEYGSLARAWGVTPVTLRPGGSIRLNPLDPGPEAVPRVSSSTVAGTSGGVGDTLGGVSDAGSPGEAAGLGRVDRRQAGLLASLAAVCMGRDIAPRERVAIDLALVTVATRTRVPTLPAVVDALLAPEPEAALSIRTDAATLLEDGRDVALELRRLVHGDLRGMFDGPTSSGLDLSGPLVVLDLSALYGSDALGVLMACATAWLQAALANRPTLGDDRREPRTASGGADVALGVSGSQVYVVVDEAWAILAHLGIARWLQSSWKLSRAHGVSNIAVLHRLSDLRSVGAAGSEQVGLAEGLLSDSETRIIYGQSPGEAAASSELLSLSATEVELVGQLRRGVALWKVGNRSFLVQHVLGRRERAVVDTDTAMRRPS